MSVVAIVILTTVLKVGLPVNSLTVGFLYLIVILILAASWGLPESALASVTATICLNYFFLPPFGTFRIADSQNWLALFTFLIASLIGSQLSERARRKAQEALSKQLEMERLYSLSRGIMLTDASQPVGMRIASEIAQIYNMRAVALFDYGHDSVYRAGPDDIERADDLLRDVVHRLTEWHDSETETTIGPVRSGNQIYGSLALRGHALSDTALHALRNLAAISLESERSRELATLAEAERHSERFKSMLLDGLAHEFKTPLTSIKAAASALITDTVRESGAQRELLSVIDQESERLGKLVTEAIHLSRIEAGKVQLDQTPRTIAGLVQCTVSAMDTALDGRRVDLELACPGLTTTMDFDLMQLALRQLIDNAAKYSPRRSPIRIRVTESDGTIHIGVHNAGDPLPESEHERIFDRFYRGSSIRHTVAGTGLGLAVAREILRAHGGDISVESTTESGTEFIMMLPLKKTVREPGESTAVNDGDGTNEARRRDRP